MSRLIIARVSRICESLTTPSFPDQVPPSSQVTRKWHTWRWFCSLWESLCGITPLRLQSPFWHLCMFSIGIVVVFPLCENPWDKNHCPLLGLGFGCCCRPSTVGLSQMLRKCSLQGWVDCKIQCRKEASVSWLMGRLSFSEEWEQSTAQCFLFEVAWNSTEQLQLLQ